MVGDPLQRPALAVLQDDHFPHLSRRLNEGVDQPRKFLVLLGLEAGRGAVGRQPGREPGSGTIQIRFDRAFEVYVELVALEIFNSIGQSG